MKGYGIITDCMNGNQSEMLEGLEGVEWFGWMRKEESREEG